MSGRDGREMDFAGDRAAFVQCSEIHHKRRNPDQGAGQGREGDKRTGRLRGDRGRRDRDSQGGSSQNL